MPIDLPPGYPEELKQPTRKIIAEAIKEFPVVNHITRQTQITKMCKRVVSRLTPDLCVSVQDEALSVMDELLHYMLVTNCDYESERERIKQETMESEEWAKLTGEMAGVPSAGQPQGQPGETTGHKDGKHAKEPPREEFKQRGRKEYVVPTTDVTLRKRKPTKKAGARTKRPEEKRAYAIVNGVNEKLPEFQRGFNILQELRRKHPGDPTRCKKELLSQKFDERLIKEIMEPRTTALRACCRYVGGTKKYVGDKRVSGKAVYNDWHVSH